MTGQGYYYGFTFKDKNNADSSHHLLSGFEFASIDDLDQFYSKIRTAFGGPNNTGNISNTLAVKRLSEWQSPCACKGPQTESTDTTKGSSPYIFNCSVRSDYGMAGAFVNGDKVNGLGLVFLQPYRSKPAA